MSPPAQVPTTGELGGGSHHHQPRWSELVPDTQPPADCSRVNISNTKNLLFVQNIEMTRGRGEGGAVLGSVARLAVVLAAAVTSLALATSMMAASVSGCNEAVCASIVSKCMLLQSCKCELQPDCTCCKRCFECLDYLYSECCSCVDMCPKPNVTIHELSRKSHVEDLEENSPTLFQALTDQNDAQGRWSVVTFPVDIDMTPFLPASKNTLGQTGEAGPGDQVQQVAGQVAGQVGTVTVNCSVAYMAQCMSWNKCKASCTSMGATSYRWFHDGCCECVGNQCVNYGINQSRCEDCPLLDDIEDDITDEEMELLVNMDYEDFVSSNNKLDG